MAFLLAQLAEALGVTPQTISDWETGIREPRKPSKKRMYILAERHGVRFNPRGYPEFDDDLEANLAD